MSETGATSRGSFVVVAEFRVKPESMEAFLGAASDDARHSIADEPGCRQFDVVAMEGEANSVVFYEVYDDRAAFDRHLETLHLKRFQAAFPALVAEERPVRFAVRHHPHG
ncbi:MULTISPECIES: putative quinol monooxygenase [unclassified Aureimonas]|uniref:putative quinol monooxygenase n=1 Tax=unclassified Aureimonas TaxID=2615206 RepID=UPI0006F3C699|nr:MULTISPECIES: putative quinol monooxygenase [unclassified Aureimonas]KQT61864.1 antibiotic biosynthesis monooxygenase [Aureimonas sp. Leaf427]KQT74895.1 antibiotic biosynthesis monooxygenase [Aureimonas sp. Leaf460]